MGRIILTTSAVILFALGMAGLFGADQISLLFLRGVAGSEVVVQVAAAGLLGFASINWMSRGSKIGGIYMRPLSIGNLLLSTVSAASLGKAFFSEQLPTIIIGLALVFSGLAFAFGWLAFGRDPLSD